ncbi:MAG: hypothetical protein ACSLEX_03480 [Minisyncoccota bacterium]
MKETKSWLRWIAVLPGALIFGILATFPLHWLIYLAFAHDGATVFGIVELNDDDWRYIEYYLYPFVIAVTFIYAGYRIAPKHKLKTAVALFVIYFTVWLIASYISLSKGDIYGSYLHFSGRTIFALIGAILGIYIVKKIDSNVTRGISVENSQEQHDENSTEN